MKRFLLPLLFLLLFILESLYVQYVPEDLFGQSKIIAPHFLFAALLFLTIFVSKKQGIIYAAIFGLLYDIVYIEIIGIYLFLFPFVAYLASKILNILQNNFIVAILITIVGIALLEVGVYEMDHLIHVTDIDFKSYINLRFYPTLILNALFVLITVYPLKRLFEKHMDAMRAD
ncbi:rod shape-determining protein MreD [Neobacillus bataviensis]|uniref:Rod shape-determining protein MreD n=1 Tax=Neobacillus bataviensis TaxID=220685 RepID=A0A561DGQ5_9BACI|nr:rod shape-determining protein MreD [Neobacillus bataviensis]TWE02547.1 rod shape-determining protein MreD [Neobacillus bataviensis]